MAEICRLPGLVKIGQLSGLFLIQDKKKFAVPMEMEGKQFALAFIDEDEGKPTLDGLMADGQQELQLGWNKLEPLVKGLAGSPFAGLIINPATDSQTILKQDDLVRLIAAIQALKGPSLFSKETLKEIFTIQRR